MKNLYESLLERKVYLEKLIATKRESTPPYSVYAYKHRQGYQYYRKDNTGVKYIKSQNINEVREILQIEYDNKVLAAAKREHKKVLELLKIYDDTKVENVYESMPDGKRILVNPVEMSDEEYIRLWNSLSYEPLGFRDNAPEFYTSKGERVRSKSEVIIANLLDKMKILYKYEKPLKLKRIGIVHPDFTILDIKNRKEIYWEHFGMIDDQVYRNNAIMKVRDYENSGYFAGDRLLITEESVNCPLDIKNVEKKLRHVLEM